MGIRCDGIFDFKNGVVDLSKLKDEVESNKLLNENNSIFLKLINIDGDCIDSFCDDKVDLEEEQEFFSLIQKCIMNKGKVIVEISCLEADSYEKTIITKDKIITKD